MTLTEQLQLEDCVVAQNDTVRNLWETVSNCEHANVCVGDAQTSLRVLDAFPKDETARAVSGMGYSKRENCLKHWNQMGNPSCLLE